MSTLSPRRGSRTSPGASSGRSATTGSSSATPRTRLTSRGCLTGQASISSGRNPPYGVAYTGKTEEALELRNDDLSPSGTRELLAAALRLAPLRAGGVFWVAAPAGPALRAFLEAIDDAGWRLHELVVWVKDRFVLGHSDLHYRHENVLVGDGGGRDASSIAYGWREGERHTYLGGRRLDTAWEIPRPSASREHPTMKPTELVARALELGTSRGDAVYDPFVGSGTTLIAAEQTGRRGFAMEIDPAYAQVTLDRWEAFTGRAAELLDHGTWLVDRG